MKRVLPLLFVCVLLAGCSTNEPSYRDGKNINVSGRIYFQPRDTFFFYPDHTVMRSSITHYGESHGTWQQECEVVKINMIYYGAPYSGLFISYGDFIIDDFGCAYYELITSHK